MDQEMFMFYRNSLCKNLCREYSDQWKGLLENKVELFRFCLKQQAQPYFATSVYQGWGLTIDFLKKGYADFINGKYIASDCDDIKGFTYGLWCGHDTPVRLTIDVPHFMGCNSIVRVPKTKCPTIYVSNKSKLDIKLGGYSSIRIYLFDESHVNISQVEDCNTVIVYKYSKDCSVTVSDNYTGKIKQFDKELRL